MMKQSFDQLFALVEDNASSVWECCSVVWEYIEAQPADDREAIFYFFLNDIDLSDFEISNPPSIDFEEKSEFRDIREIEQRIIKALVSENNTEEAFYHKLWEKINDPYLFETAKEQAAFLCVLWLDSRIPYFQLEEGSRMDNDEYQAISQKLKPLLKKANYILNTTIEQKTQRASLLMAIADNIVDEREKTVFWAKIISRPTARINFNLIAQKIAEALVEKGVKDFSITKGDDKE